MRNKNGVYLSRFRHTMLETNNNKNVGSCVWLRWFKDGEYFRIPHVLNLIRTRFPFILLITLIELFALKKE